MHTRRESTHTHASPLTHTRHHPPLCHTKEERKRSQHIDSAGWRCGAALVTCWIISGEGVRLVGGKEAAIVVQTVEDVKSVSGKMAARVPVSVWKRSVGVQVVSECLPCWPRCRVGSTQQPSSDRKSHPLLLPTRPCSSRLTLSLPSPSHTREIKAKSVDKKIKDRNKPHYDGSKVCRKTRGTIDKIRSRQNAD